MHRQKRPSTQNGSLPISTSNVYDEFIRDLIQREAWPIEVEEENPLALIIGLGCSSALRANLQFCSHPHHSHFYNMSLTLPFLLSMREYPLYAGHPLIRNISSLFHEPNSSTKSQNNDINRQAKRGQALAICDNRPDSLPDLRSHTIGASHC